MMAIISKIMGKAVRSSATAPEFKFRPQGVTHSLPSWRHFFEGLFIVNPAESIRDAPRLGFTSRDKVVGLLHPGIYPGCTFAQD